MLARREVVEKKLREKNHEKQREKKSNKNVRSLEMLARVTSKGLGLSTKVWANSNPSKLN
jgi:hypothetical protein